MAAEAARSLAMMEGADTVDSLLELVNTRERGAAFVNALYGLCRLGVEWGLHAAIAYIGDASQPMKRRCVFAMNIALRREPDLLPVVDQIADVFATVPEIMQQVVLYYAEMGRSRSSPVN